jgi:Tfp pilus assembly protein PilV
MYKERVEGQRCLRPGRGLSLVEIVLAIGIAAISVITVLVIFSYVFANARSGKLQAKAAAIGQGYVERVKADKDFFKAVQAAPGSNIVRTETEPVYDGETSAPITFTSSVALTPRAFGTSQRPYADVLVTVSWKERETLKSTTLETYFPAW